MFQQDDIFRNGVALLAFVMAFYALIARERKTPYIVHSVYSIALLVLTALLLSLVAVYLDHWFPPTTHPGAPVVHNYWASLLNTIAAFLLGLGLVYILYRIWREQNRHVFFRDDQLLLNTTVCRGIVAFWHRLRARKRYEHNPMSLPDALIQSLKESPYLKTETLEKTVAHYRAAPDLSISAVFEIADLFEMDRLNVDIAARFLKNNCFVQYMSCARHPIEFLMQLRSHWQNDASYGDWKTVFRKIVVVDGFTPHFGYTDSIYPERSKQAADDCLAVVTAKRTYAGIHTATATAFNRIKQADSENVRSPTLVIYEGCAALIDLESPEQYRIFVRHVLPSERLWGGMFTMFVETSLSNENRAVLKGAADIFVDFQPTDQNAISTKTT